MAPGGQHRRPLCRPRPQPTITRTSRKGMATLAGLPGVSVVSASYGCVLDTLGQEGPRSRLGSTILGPALAANPDVSFFASSGDSGASYGLIYPSASPEVVSVGGTSLFLNAKNSGAAKPAGATATWRFFGGSGGGLQPAFAVPTYQQDDGFAGKQRSSHQPRRRRRRRPEYRRGRLRPLRFRRRDPLGPGRRHQPGGAAVGRHGRDRRPGPRRSPAADPRLDRDADGPLQPREHRPRRLPRHHPGNNGYRRRARLRPGHRAGLAPGQPPHPRPGRLRPGQQAIIATEPPPTVVQGDIFGIIAQATDSIGSHRPDLHRHRDPLARERAGRRHLHAGDRPGHRRPGGLRRTCRWARCPTAPTTSSRSR